MARRTKLNAEVQRKILQAIQAGSTYEIAANFAGISRTTLFYWMRKGEEQKKGYTEHFLTNSKERKAWHVLVLLRS